MEDYVRIVQEHYNSDVQKEWDRLERHPFEFAITIRMMDRYIKPGDRILDIGGGPEDIRFIMQKKAAILLL